MHISVSEEPQLIVARLEGRFDAHTVSRFNENVVEAVGPELRNVIVDLGGVEFMDSSALAALVTTLKRTMEHSGDVVLAGVADAARIILELTRLDQVFAQAPSVDDARLELRSVTC